MYTGEYQLVGSEMSFFTRKLEAQLRFQRIPWRYLFKTEERKAELEAKAGTHFIPLIITPDKWLNVARLHVQDELLRAGAKENAGVQALFAGRSILEYYLD